MPSFEYTAIDRQGNSVSGQIQATNRDEAALNLTRTGLLVSRLAESGAAPIQQRAQVQQTQIGSGSAPILAGSPPVLSGAGVRQAPKAAAVAKPPAKRPAPQAKKPPIRTKPGRDKDIYFIFSQLQSYAKAGANPVEYLSNLSRNSRRKDYADALQEAADAAKEGKPISDVFERYIDLFPPHVVGMVRAAEYGGFFPEAYDLITDQAQASHKFRIWFKWLLGVAIMVGACLPVMALMLKAGLDSWDAQEKSGGTAPGWSTFFGSIGREFLWPYGPVSILLCVGVWLFARSWQAMPRRQTRHRLTLIVPTVKKRARAESLSVFAWTMAMLSKVGLAPKTVWELSVGTIPNLEVRRQLEQTGQRMSEQTKLSEAMAMSHQMPEEYAPIVQTGEITGDLPGALLRASQSQLEEFKASDQGTKARVGCWMLLLMGLGSAILLGMYYGGFMPMLMKKISGEE